MDGSVNERNCPLQMVQKNSILTFKFSANESFKLTLLKNKYNTDFPLMMYNGQKRCMKAEFYGIKGQ